MKVKATRLGFFDHMRRHPGAVFDVPENLFSERWMKKIGAKEAAEVEEAEEETEEPAKPSRRPKASARKKVWKTSSAPARGRKQTKKAATKSKAVTRAKPTGDADVI